LRPSHVPVLLRALHEMLESNHWDVGFLGWCKSFKTPSRFPLHGGFTGAHAYTLTRQSAQILISALFPLDMQVDYGIQAIATFYTLRVRPTPLDPVKQGFTGGSDISALLSLRSLRDIPSISLLVILLLLVFLVLRPVVARLET
jgi:hypothetical protein